MDKTTAPPPACTKCGLHPCRIDHAGKVEDLCVDCENTRIKEIDQIGDRHEKHPDECCCPTYLGRACCLAPVHGDRWRVNAISDGERFCYIIRAHDRNEALKVGKEMCEDNGEECISVAKVQPDPCVQCQKECGDRCWRLKRIRGHFCSEVCCDRYKDSQDRPTPPVPRCWECGKEFTSGGFRLKEFRGSEFCSRECGREYHTKYVPATKCSKCDKECGLRTWRSGLLPGMEFCSAACAKSALEEKKAATGPA